MTDGNSTSDDLRIDALIDRIRLARRTPGGIAADQALADVGPEAALIAQLCQLRDIEWPADEIGDRIADGVAAAAGQPPSSAYTRPLRAAPLRSHRRRWLIATATAAAALAAVGVFQLTRGAHGVTSHRPAAGGSRPAQVTSPASTTPAAPPTWLTSMRVVSKPGSLTAIGTVNITSNFLTCVTRSVCYTIGSLAGGIGDIARSVDGGAAWTAGAQLPSTGGQFDVHVNASCPHPLACFLPYGPEILATSDGFAHFQALPVTMPSGPPGEVSMVSCPTTQRCVAAVNQSSASQPFIYSDNGGMSWAAASSPAVSPSDIIGGLRCDPDGACIAAVVAGTAQDPLVAALSSTDSGQSWTMSPTSSIVNMVRYMVSCPDGHHCVVGADSGYLAWVSTNHSGHISIRVQAPPTSWTTNLAASTMTVYEVSCATASECFADLGSGQLAATRDGGLTWTSAPLDPSLPQDNAVYMSCPVAAGCVALASDGLGDQSSWVVLSNLPGTG
jgi:hypothetical protein